MGFGLRRTLFQPTKSTAGAYRVGIPAHHNGRFDFRLPINIFCRYIVFCRCGGLEAHPTTKPAVLR
ncbi:MAG: hypothetical protein IKZ88_05585 [Neisseriaceae bacterium]|nr:hypothetical protein [Neisseriaceae bacterium]